MKILIVGPVPPPMTGNALPVKVLWEALDQEPDVDVSVINTSKKKHKSAIGSLGRILEIVRILYRIWKEQAKNDIIYLTIAESLSGNLRDIFIYFICRKRVDTLYVHMFGGAGMKLILEKKNTLRYRINKYFLRGLAGIIVEGLPQHHMFSRIVDEHKVHVVPNFAQDFLLTDEKTVVEKFSSTTPLKVLFLSNMLPGKGHFELIDAYKQLDSQIKEVVTLTFAGKMVSTKDENLFYDKTKGEVNIHFLGGVYDNEKKKVFLDAHVFCLPTYYPYEGQPFSIIEAYATGCVVITTDHSGIGFIFKDNVNGFQVEKKSVESLKDVLQKAVRERASLCQIALHNVRQVKELYTSDKYIRNMKNILLDGRIP